MISDSDLVDRLRDILRSSDLDTATPGSVRRQLEEQFKLDLSDRKTFISDQIDIFLQTLEEENEEVSLNENVEDENDTVEQEEEVEEEEAAAEEEESVMKEEKSYDVVEEVKKRRGGFNKLCSLSPQLQKLVGVPELARTEVVKRVWQYIKENNLQDPKNKKRIICDDSFKALFHVNSIDMFKMNKALSKHIWPSTPMSDIDEKSENVEQKIEDEDSHGSVSEDKKHEEELEEEEEEHEKTSKRGSKKKGSAKVDTDVRKRGGGFTKLCSLSPELQTFIGESELARTEVVKKLWSYIRENNLQDPKNKRNIICDEPLHALFQVSSINMFQMNKALSKHIWPLVKEDAPANPTQKEKRCKEVEEGEIRNFKPTGYQLAGCR